MYGGMVLGLSDAAIAALGSSMVAMITGAVSLIGILLSTSRQKEPVKLEAPKLTTDCDDCSECREALAAMTEDRDTWKALALEWRPRRREGDPPAAGD